MRRFVTLALLLIFSIPVGISITGCAKKVAVDYCNGGSSGMVVGQITTINLEPRLYGISLNYGGIGQISSPSALDCKGNTVGVVRYTYGTTNNTYADISPSGSICAGTWNRNTAGGVADYTTCIPPSATLSIPSAGSSYTPVAYITASAGGAVSNPVPIYVHPTVSNVVLQPQTTCFSQGSSTTLNAKVYTSSNIDITALAGPLTFTPQDSSVVSINSTVIPPVATAQLPGSTILTASTSNASSSGSASTTGVWYTCPPTKITLAAAGTSSTSITLNQNNPIALTATVVDANNTLLTGLNLQYISTSPQTVAATTSGVVTATYPGAGAITALCQPPSCNNAPLSILGTFGNGLPLTSNPINVTTPGTVNTVLYMASTHSQYFANVDFLTGVVGSPIRLPYVPNSMISDQAGTTLYMGSPTELMEVSTYTNSISKEDASVKGTVIGVSNDGSVVVLSDAVHNLIYIYYTSGGTSISFGGTATHAAFSPDDSTIYITGLDALGHNFFVYSNYNGWHQYTLTDEPKDVTISVPSIAAFVAGASTAGAHTSERSYCAAGVPPTDYFPEVSTSQAFQSDRLAATFDGKHLLGATATGALLADIPLTTSTGTSNPGACSTFFNLTAPYTLPLGVTPSSVTAVIPRADSALAFITYTTASTTTTGTKLPLYTPSATGVGAISAVTLLNGATAPVSGIFSPDGFTFYTGTSGDNLVHIISVSTTTDTKTLNPSLFLCAAQDANGNCTSNATTFATPDLLADKPRPTT
jgi:hypothetical protein